MSNEKGTVMQSKIAKFVLSLVALGGLFSSGVANAQNCSTWASNIINYQQVNHPTWGARLSTDRADGKLVSYSATGGGNNIGYPLKYVAGHWSNGAYFPPSLQSTASQYQYFSDRTYSPDINGTVYNDEPFDPAATDHLGVTIWLGSGSLVQPGEVTFTLYTWGNALVNFVPVRCDAVGAAPSGVVYGLSGNTGLLLSLFTGLQLPPS
jgi:hypothetical protein